MRRTEHRVCCLMVMLLLIGPAAGQLDEGVEASFSSLAIKVRAYEISHEITSYLNAHPEKTIDDLREDRTFRDLAVQRVGDTGYTYVVGAGTGIVYFHPFDAIRGNHVNVTRETFPEAWRLTHDVIESPGCGDSEGYYPWADETGRIREKYVYHTCVPEATHDGVRLFVGASTYLDEYEAAYGRRHPTLPRSAQTTANLDTAHLQTEYSIVAIGVILLILAVGVGLNAISEKRNVVFLLMLLVSLVISGLFVYNTYMIGQTMHQDAARTYNQQQLFTVQAKASALQLEFSELQRELAILAEAVAEADAINESVGPYLRRSYHRNSDIAYASYRINASGFITDMYPPDPASLGADISGQAHMRTVAATMEPVFSGVFDAVEGFKGITPHHPVIREGDYDGTVAYLLDVEELLSFARETGQTTRATVWVIDDQGSIVSAEDAGSVGRSFANLTTGAGDGRTALVKSVLSGHAGTLQLSQDGGDQLAAYYPFAVGDSTWGVILATDEKYAFEAIADDLERVWTLTFATIAALLFVSVLFAHILTKALREEVRGKTEELERVNAELDDRVAEKTRELRTLTRTLEKQVAERTEEIEKRLKEAEEMRAAMLNILEDSEESRQQLEATTAKLQSTNKKLRTAQREIKQFNRELEATVSRRTKQLEDANREVRRLLKLKTDFINQLSHDLRTPLTPILTLLPIIRDHVTEEQDRQDIDVVIHNSYYLRDLVNDTLNLARLDSGTATLALKHLDLERLLEGIIYENTPVFEENRIAVKKDTPTSLPPIYGDELRLREVFMNLIANAVKFMPDGGTLTYGARREDGSVVVSIADTGTGIDAAVKEHIFDEFFKGDQSRHERSSGLGLAIAKRIMERHNGDIWVESQGKDRGATFYLRFPCPQLKRDLTVASIMRKGVHTATDTDTLYEVAKRMTRQGVDALAVVDADGRLKGLLSEGDILRHGRGTPATKTVGRIDYHTVTTIGPDDTIIVANERMQDAHARRLVVVDDEQRPIGIISSREVAQGYNISLRDLEIPIQRSRSSQVRYFMNAAVESLPESATVASAADHMAQRDIGVVVVTRGKRPVGVFSVPDYIKRVVAKKRDPADTLLSEVMSTPVISTPPHASVAEALALMAEKRIRHLPVVVDDAPVGMFSLSDILKAVHLYDPLLVDRLLEKR